MTETKNLYQSLNLDEFDDPKFEVCLFGETYRARLVTFQDVMDLDAHEKKLQAEGIFLDGFEGMKSRLSVIFPDIPQENINRLSFAKCAALLREVLLFFNENLRAATGGLESFHKGGSVVSRSTSPE